MRKMTFHEMETEQFRQMFTRYYPRLVRMAVQMTGDRDEARDIVADVMETAWRKRKSIDHDGQGAWLYACVRNACINSMKRTQGRNVSIERLTAIADKDGDGRGEGHEQLLQRVEAVAGEITEPTKSIVRMCYYEHNTYKQTAERLGISPETVKKHIQKALRLLRERVKREED